MRALIAVGLTPSRVQPSLYAVQATGGVAAWARPPTNPPASKSIQRIESKEQLGTWKGSQLIGAKVEDPSGKNIGAIEDVMVDSSGRVQFAVLSFGGFLGVGEKWYAVPWNALHVERNGEGTRT